MKVEDMNGTVRKNTKQSELYKWKIRGEETEERNKRDTEALCSPK